MVGGLQQDAAQADEVAGDRERDDLTAAAWEILVTAGPTRLKNERLMSGFALAHELPAALNVLRHGLQFGEPLLFACRQRK